MKKELLPKFKEALEEEKTKLENELSTFATKDASIENNWDAKHVNREDTDMEEKADEVTEYDNLLSLEHTLELKLKDVVSALEKIEKGGYGVCEKCGKEIEEKRLKVCPEGRLCMKCKE
ncbi:TraR/DksA C4-type zinc finger protein [Candidatus Parcubacteria bacterium]|nr:TraR/DksA C4-type zinc finger protein [Candidatus Parcubacteria bacterium]